MYEVTPTLRRIKLPWVLLFAFSLIAALFIPIIGFLFFCIVLTTRVSARISFLEKLFLIFFAGLMFNALIYGLLLLFNFAPPIQFAGIFYIFLSSFIYLRWANANKAAFISRRFIACIILATIVFSGLMYPVFVSNNSHPSRTLAVLHLLSAGEDNASHYALYKYAYTHDQFAYSYSSGNKTGLINTLVNYPQGSEFTMAWLSKSVLSNSFAHDEKLLILTYYFWCALFYAALASMGLLLALAMYESFGKTLEISQLCASVILTFGLISIGPMLYLMGRGFQSQIFSYIYFLGLLYAVLPITFVRNFSIRILFMLLMVVGICLSWWFLAPLAACALLWFIVRNLNDLRHWITLKKTIAIILLGALTIYPIIFNILSGSTDGNILLIDGGVDTLAPTTVSLCLLSWFLFMYLNRRQVFDQHVGLHSALAGGILMSFIIGLYQKLNLGHFSYYYYKSLYIIVLLSTILAVYVTLVFLEKMVRGIKNIPQIQIILSIILICAFTSYLIVIKPVYPRVYANDWFNNSILPTDLSALLNTSQSKYRDLIYVADCHPGATYILNRWSGAVFLSENNSWHRDIEKYNLQNKQSKLRELISHPRPNNARIFIYAETACVSAQSRQVIVQSGSASNLN